MGGQGAELSIIFGNFVELCSRRESQPTRCRLYSELSQVHTSFVFAVGSSVRVPDFRLFLESEQPLDRDLETLIYNAYSRKCSPPRDWTGTPLPTNVREVNLTLAGLPIDCYEQVHVQISMDSNHVAEDWLVEIALVMRDCGGDRV